MKIEIWSDIMCPFCYIGKRRFEEALATFEWKNGVEIEWKSFLLSPELKTDPNKNIHEYLAEHKNISLEEAKGMNDYVTNMAAQVGLTYNFDKAIPANSFNAHRFLHFAKKHGKQNEAEERLFKAYFTEGKNIDDAQTLLLLAIELELDANKLADAMNNGEFTNDVIADINEAQQLGVRGVPFFVFNRKYAVSGAQESEAFTQTLEKAFEEWQACQPKTSFETIKGESCDIDGNCD
ncbi:DSBA oxidoreductase [Flavobacterium beibuense F44-8]|uniref:DSBA oxidoreductase n=1 Tax=Flavobacterium beibuense F44-8 TaxID=1406840 RepID=A0A0A2LYH1_9FLAO|nr:DsbA family oxidoreductase [Flavobacterium beibuense]KGO81140.1 DSBA oxidoreductase [Flavobacterium beibuense F44-8]